jgi:hypothetical protein
MIIMKLKADCMTREGLHDAGGKTQALSTRRPWHASLVMIVTPAREQKGCPRY